LISDCLDKGFDYAGTDVDTLRNIADPATCQRKCQANPNCFFFNFNNGNCWLKSTMTGPFPCAACTSGPRICKSCFSYQYNSVGSDITYFTNVASSTACQQKCQDLATCKFFVHNQGSSTCWLKSSENPTKTYNHNFIFGPKTCPDCFLNQIDIPGNDITALPNIQNSGDCQQKCRDTANCNYFLYKNDPLCFLKTNASAPISDARAIAMGPKTCTSCFQYQYMYPGNDITTLFNIYNPQDCQIKCQLNSQCKFFMFSLLTNTCW
jgi:coagulation factor 11